MFSCGEGRGVRIADIVVGDRYRKDLGDVAGLAASIAAVGLLHPPIVTPDNRLVCGYRRLRACESLGWDEVEVRVFEPADLLLAEHDENEFRKAFTVSERVAIAKAVKERAGERRGRPKTEEEIPEISPEIPSGEETREIAAEKAGFGSSFTLRQAEKVVEQGVPELVEAVDRGEVSISAAAEVAESPPEEQREIVARGEREIIEAAKRLAADRRERAAAERRQRRLAEMAEKAESAPGAGEAAWRVEHGDCLDHLRAVGSGTVNLVFADPPYNIGFDYGEGYDDDQPRDRYLAWVSEWVAECARVLAPDGAMWVLINDEYAAEYAITLDRHGLVRRNWVIWYETFGVNCPNKFNRTKRHLLYTVKDASRFVFNAAAVSRPSDRQLKYDDPRANPDGKVMDDVWLDIPRLVGTAAERVPDFPTQLPLALLRRVVGCCTDPGDLVLDPFNGSGTTGAAAVAMGRRYVGVERSERFAGLARLRLKGVVRETV